MPSGKLRPKYLGQLQTAFDPFPSIPLAGSDQLTRSTRHADQTVESLFLNMGKSGREKLLVGVFRSEVAFVEIKQHPITALKKVVSENCVSKKVDRETIFLY